mmetsp:Transcript_9194/g.25858  ORF Transcript_9194/g.25858 Transcript_9194/m.25858 type:complete len:82 (+) Transcript_9194:789-1034(+)
MDDANRAYTPWKSSAGEAVGDVLDLGGGTGKPDVLVLDGINLLKKDVFEELPVLGGGDIGTGLESAKGHCEGEHVEGAEDK